MIMKTLTALLAVVVAIAVAAGYYHFAGNKTSKTPVNDSEVTATQAETEEQTKRMEELRTAKEQAEAQAKNLARLADDLGAQLNSARSNATALTSTGTNGSASSAPADGAKGFGSMIAKMMQNPDTKQFIRNQQRTTVDQLYGPLTKKLGLAPEHAQQFKDMITDNMMKGAEKAQAMFGGSQADRAQAMRELAEDQKLAQAEIRSFLGEEAFLEYQDYSLTLQERSQLNMFRQQGGGENPISDQQAEQLLAIMSQEKKAVAPELAQAFNDQTQPAAGMDAVLSEERAAKMLAAQEALNARISARAGEVLGPEQEAAFLRFQTNQLGMMRAGLSMARQMFGPEDSSSR